MSEHEKIHFQAKTNELLHLIIHSLYSNKDVFLRELISNSCDAIEKYKYAAKCNDYGSIEISLNENQIHIKDNGIGMTRNELIENLGTIAESGTKQFCEQIKDQGMIGQFGFGFYSSFLISSKVQVFSRSLYDTQTFLWTSEGIHVFHIQKSDFQLDSNGTLIILTMKPELQENYCNENKIKEIIQKNCQYIDYPILFKNENLVKKPLWLHPNAEKEEYIEFFRHFTKDYEEPLMYKHVFMEGNIDCKSLLFLPKRCPENTFYTSKHKNIHLYVRKVFVTDETEDFVPEHFQFIHGIIDCENLPLHVSREFLQKTQIVKTIKKMINKKIVEMIEEFSQTSEDEYLSFYNTYSRNLKLGIYDDDILKPRLLDLLRFYSVKYPTHVITLDDYVNEEKEKKIYYLTGEKVCDMIDSPFIEKLKKENQNVLFFTEPIDEYLMNHLKHYHEIPFINCAKEIQIENTSNEYNSICNFIQEVLKDDVELVKTTNQLTDTPMCIKSRYTGNMERVLAANALNDNQNVTIKNFKTIVINPEHDIIKKINKELERKEDENFLKDLVRLLYDSALLDGGFQVIQPKNLVKRIHNMVRIGLSLDDKVNKVERKIQQECNPEIEITKMENNNEIKKRIINKCAKV